MKLCPKCSAELKDTAKFCSECGLNLKQYEQQNSKRCSQCGAPVSGKYCDECGAKVEETVDSGSIGSFDFSAINGLATDQLYVKEGFEVENGVLIKYKGKKRNVTIPNTIEEIYDAAFENNDVITIVEIQQGVKFIGKRAFANCSSLSKVSIPASCTKTYDDAFTGVSLDELELECFTSSSYQNIIKNLLSAVANKYISNRKIVIDNYIINKNDRFASVRFNIRQIEAKAMELKRAEDLAAAEAEAQRLAEIEAKRKAEEKAKKEAEEKKKAEAKRKAEEKKKAEEARQKEIASWYVGSVHKLGKYKGYPLEWIVVSVSDEGYAEVVSKYGVDYLSFHSTSFTDVQWKDSQIRKWLNNDFFNAAFTYSEKCKILEANVAKSTNPQYKYVTEATCDYLYLLSCYQAEKFFPNPNERACPPLGFLSSQSDFKSSVEKWGLTLNKSWWLRTKGTAYDSTYVTGYGEIEYGGSIISNKHLVRPAMLIQFK